MVKYWTLSEYIQLRELRDDHRMTFQEIGKQLGRTDSAIMTAEYCYANYRKDPETYCGQFHTIFKKYDLWRNTEREPEPEQLPDTADSLYTKLKKMLISEAVKYARTEAEKEKKVLEEKITKLEAENKRLTDKWDEIQKQSILGVLRRHFNGETEA